MQNIVPMHIQIWKKYNIQNRPNFLRITINHNSKIISMFLFQFPHERLSVYLMPVKLKSPLDRTLEVELQLKQLMVKDALWTATPRVQEICTFFVLTIPTAVAKWMKQRLRHLFWFRRICLFLRTVRDGSWYFVRINRRL